MKTYAYSLVTFGSRQISIGRQGENLATRIDVDVAPWKTEYPTGTISLFVVPPVGSGYLAAIEVHENTVRWPIRDTDTAYDGSGKAELILKDADGTVIKSVTAYTTCIPSISADEPADPPEAIRPWVEQILDAIESGGVGPGGGGGGDWIDVGTVTLNDDVNIWDIDVRSINPDFTGFDEIRILVNFLSSPSNTKETNASFRPRVNNASVGSPSKIEYASRISGSRSVGIYVAKTGEELLDTALIIADNTVAQLIMPDLHAKKITGFNIYCASNCYLAAGSTARIIGRGV